MRRALPLTLATAVAAALLLAGCTPSTPPVTATATATATRVAASLAPSPSASTPSASPTATVAPAPTPVATTVATTAPTSSAGGCAGSTTALPAGAVTARIPDVDGDGAADTLFLTASAPRVIGIRTAGGVVTLPDLLPAGHARTAWLTSTDGAPGRTIVVDDGTTATVQAFRDCRLVRIDDADGRPLELPLGGTAAAATGVACNDQNGGILIEASRVTRRSDGRSDIAWRTLDRVDSRDRADFSAPETRWSGLAASDLRVAQARTSHCWAATGTVTAG